MAIREPHSTEEAALHGWLYIVADGVGGAEAGEIASSYATKRTVYHFLSKSDIDNKGERLRRAILAAHYDLCHVIGERQDHQRMATTIVAAMVHERKIYFANVGDSRAYLLRQAAIEQITKDHSLVEKLLEEGIISAEEAGSLPIGNIILQSIGSDHEPVVDLFDITLLQDDIIVLCSDGLTTHVKDAEIAEIASQHAPQTATEKLIELANFRGGHDNISVLVLQVGSPAADKTLA